MIYLVTNQLMLFDDIKCISVEESLNIIKEWSFIQYDSETSGKDCHLCTLLCAQFGSPDGETQIVVDTVTIDIKHYKKMLETKLLVGQNLKFDLQFLYNYGIIPTMIYDTMIVEQFLHLGYPSGVISYSLQAIAQRRLNIWIDKDIRGEIIWRGLDLSVIHYAAGDVKYLAQIMHSQLDDLKKADNAIIGARIECDFVPAIAYLEWCGIKLDKEKWQKKMDQDLINLLTAEKELSDYAVHHPKLQKWVKVDNQGDLFEGFSLEPKWGVDWQKKEVIEVVKALGFNVTTVSKVTKKESESVMEKVLSSQKGIDDKFLELYFKYQGYYKVISSFGQGHLNAINPVTGRIHTVYKQLGAASGRMSCGSQQPNEDLAKFKHINPKDCTYPNMQQLPADEATRSAFVAEEGNLFCSCDFAALESRLGADIYQEKAMLDEFLHGSGDMHSLCAKMVFKDELKDIEVKDVKSKRPDLRKKVKSVEFAKQFGGSSHAISGTLGCSIEEADKFSKAYDEGFKGVTSFKEKGSKFVREHGYVLMCKHTGHRMNWYGWNEWKEEQKSFTPEFWEDYRANHKGTNDEVARKVSEHFKTASKWDRMALNAVTQGTGSIILKDSATTFFKWIINNGYFGKVLLCALVHDEIDFEFPKELEDVCSEIIQKIMLESAAKYCKSLPIPADASTGTHWIH